MKNKNIGASLRILALACVLASAMVGTTSSCGKYSPCFDKDL